MQIAEMQAQSVGGLSHNEISVSVKTTPINEEVKAVEDYEFQEVIRHNDLRDTNQKVVGDK